MEKEEDSSEDIRRRLMKVQELFEMIDEANKLGQLLRIKEEIRDSYSKVSSNVLYKDAMDLAMETVNRKIREILRGNDYAL